MLCLCTTAEAARAQGSGGNVGLYYAAPGENLEAKIRQNMRIEVQLSKQQVYEGEPLEAAYHLWVALDVQGKITRAPSYRGFAAYDLSYGSGGDYEVVPQGNVLYKKYLIKRVLLYPLQWGTLRLEPVAMDANVRFLKLAAGGTPSYEYPTVAPADTTLAISIESLPTEVKVLPVPSPAPAGYRGAVGSYTLSSRLLPDTVAAGATCTLEVTITGKGHHQALQAPAIEWPEGITAYEPERTEVPGSTQGSVPEGIVWRYPLVAQAAGTYTIPALSLTYFEPKEKQYATSQSQPLALIATPAVPAEAAIPAGTARPSDYTRIFSRVVIYLFPAAALGLLVWLVWQHHKKKTPHAQRAEYTLPPTPKAAQAAQATHYTPQQLQQQMLQWLQAHTGMELAGPYAPGLPEEQLPWLPALRELWKKCKVAETVQASEDELQVLHEEWAALQQSIRTTPNP